MSDFDDEQDNQADEENGDTELPKGTLAALTKSFSTEQWQLWKPVRRAWEKQVANLKKARGASNRDYLHESINRAQGNISQAKIEKLIDNAVAKGDPQALRIMAQMAGIDLSDRPQQAAGEGAKVIIIRPHPLLLSEAQEADVQRQITEY